MLILAFDPAVRTGWTHGHSDRPGVLPRVGVKRLKEGKDATPKAARSLGQFVRDICFLEETRPDLIVYEMYLPSFDAKDGRQRKIIRSAESIDLPRNLVGAIEAVAGCYGIETVAVYPNTWKAHFLGHAFAKGEDPKAATIRTCHLLGYLPHSCKDDNQADSAGIWDWAASKFGGRIPQELRLHGQGALRHG